MKFSLFCLFLLIAGHCFAQEKIGFTKSTDKTLSGLLNNLREYKRLDGSELSVRLYLVADQKKSGSAESDEVSDNLYIAVSEFDETPKQELFILSDIFGVTNLEIVNDSTNRNLILSFSYFDRNIKLRKKIIATITLAKITVKTD